MQEIFCHAFGSIFGIALVFVCLYVFEKRQAKLEKARKEERVLQGKKK